jgi:hypothetical protein
MPTGTAWLGTISSQCITMLGGLFEMRPSHRLGCGTHRGRLQHHPWLAMYGYSDWDSMHQLRIKPAFRPGKRFMEEQFSEGAGEKGKEKERQLVPNPGEAPALSKEQQHEFRHFDYIRPQHDELFLPVHNPASPVHTQRSISEMFSSTIAKTLKGSASPKASPVSQTHPVPIAAACKTATTTIAPRWLAICKPPCRSDRSDKARNCAGVSKSRREKLASMAVASLLGKVKAISAWVNP